MANPLFAEVALERPAAAMVDARRTTGPARDWPVQDLRLQGIWQQSGVLHAVLGGGLDQVVVAPGQAVGREAYRVRRVGMDEVVLQAPGDGRLLHLGWTGGPR